MTHKILNKSIVILADLHNPTIVTTDFFIKINYIKDVTEIDENNIIITPAYSRIVFKNNVELVLEPDRLEIKGDENGDIENLAMLYCNNLKYIRCRGIGINYNLELSEFDSEKYLDNMNKIKYKDTFIRAIEYRYIISDKIICNIKLVGTGGNKAFLNFNFDHSYTNTILDELRIKFEEEKVNNLKRVDDFKKNIKL